ncbi:MAG: hypothetical protein A3G59_02990 [Candidatus Taylorbacteria bacterium RIFCSPLOWO2_12_FULL_47_20]|uniref:CYTH domain-containing protein n=2 Tax=Candidatus Tayloriibacteriota TaxID=1817919 RepID=A0A1G2P7S0_9BACT|nr:MAG: hypothetical protein A3H68_01670 [Candidatus Taylorbacteria bacterium RIFCSPLOWO2_02_FULL_46_40]OHA44360.1 MAG: hypothetical protein A3G59_02990 [Candidatus Taylorbacteria bacterium RIFCSPLOWO2_12_FULL_47_20]
MIEIEKNFDLKNGDKEKLIADATFLRKITLTDTYYDTKDFRLTTKDHWLRQRNGRFELKTPINSTAADRITDQYREIENDKEIINALSLPGDKPLIQTLSDAGINPFVTIITKRQSYKKGEFHLDFDEMDFGFSTFEAELMIENESDSKTASDRIMEFAKQHGLEGSAGDGKVIEYLKRNNPKHYEALVSAKITRERA